MSRTCPECKNQYEDDVEACPEDSYDLTSVEPDDELLGRTIGSYQILRPLGKGGMGAVYMAQHPVIGSKVAIKFLHPQYATDKKIVDRFFNEARAVNVIGHDNILKILDLNVTEDNRHYFIMEFLYGRALQKLVEEGKPNTLEVVGPIMLQFCEALQAAHDHQIYHRDIKPDNVYLIVHKGKKNFVKVVDFGIAKLTDGSGQSTGATQTGMVMGTPAYMSPEQAGGMTNKIGATSDIYSTGAMMFQMCTGKLPFPGSSFGEVLIGHLQLPPPIPHEINPEIVPELEAIILKALSKKQEDRQQSMNELHDEIKAVMEQYGVSAELPAADDEDIKKAAAINQITPGTKTMARPATKMVSRPGTNPGRQNTPAPQQQATMLEAPPPPPKSNIGMFVGIGVAALLLVGGGVGFAIYSSGEKRAEAAEKAAHEAAAHAAEAAAKAVAEANKKAAAEAAPAADAPVFLSIVSDPPGAKVEATWTGGMRNGDAPMDFSVPKNMKVRFQFTKPGFLPYTQDVIADSPQVVKAALQADASAKVAVAKAGGDAPAGGDGESKKKKKKVTSKNPSDPDGDIQIDF